jgi:hypothetical protein
VKLQQIQSILEDNLLQESKGSIYIYIKLRKTSRKSVEFENLTLL